MTATAKADEAIEAGSRRLRHLSESAAARGGVAARLAQPLAEDAEFLRKLKPSLIRERASGATPEGALAPARSPRPAARPSPRNGNGARSPLALVGAALAAGVGVAKLLDWRGHAHPRD